MNALPSVAARCLAAAFCLFSLPALADRPYLATTSANAEEDDDKVWAVETWYEKTGEARGLSAQAGFSWSPGLGGAVTASRSRESGLWASGLALEGTWLPWRPARDGFGLGLSLEVDYDRASGEGWRRDAFTAVVPLTVPLWDRSVFVTANLGQVWPNGGDRQNLVALALEGEVARRTTLFAETARIGDSRLVHGGVRYFVKKEKFSIDLGVLRRSEAGESRNGIVLGFSVFDL